MRGVRLAVPVATAVAILFIDFDYVGVLVFSGILAATTWLELLIFGLQFGKTAAFLTIRDMRQASLPVLIDLYGTDLAVLPLLVIAYFAFDSRLILTAASQLFIGWIAGVAPAAMAYSAYRIGKMMSRSRPLSAVLPSSFVAAEVGVLFLSSANSAAALQSGLEGVVRSVIVTQGGNAVASVPILVSLGIVYVSTLLYATLGLGAKAVARANQALLLAVLATFFTGGYVLAFGSFTPVVVFILLPPTFTIVGVLWWAGRA